MKRNQIGLGIGLVLLAGGSALAQDFYPSGILHQPLGGAVLGPATDRRLPVRNIGSSGQDGVEIQLRSVFGGGTSVESHDFPFTAGATIKIRHKGWDGTIKGSTRKTSNGAGGGYDTFDFSPVGVTSIQVTDYDDHGAIISSGTYPGPLIDVPWVGIPNQCNPPCSWVSFARWAIVNGKWHLVTWNRCVCPGTDTGNGTGWQNARVVTPMFPPGYEPDGMESMRVTAQGIPEFTVTATEMDTFGLPWYGLGQAQISEECPGTVGCTPSDRRLPVRNLGSSGQDGVAVHLPPNGGMSVRHVKTGHVTLLKAFDDGSQEISRLAESSNPLTGADEVTCDFTGMACSAVQVTCYNAGGGVIDSRVFSGITMTIALLDPCPPGSYYVKKFINGHWTWLCQSIIDMVLPGGTVVPGVSSVEIAGLGGTARQPRRLELTGQGPGELTIAELSLLPVPCVADVDDGTGSGTPDGGVTIDDLLYYLNIFDAGLPSADVDDGTGTGTHDGGVTIDDLLYYLFRFDAGC